MICQLRLLQDKPLIYRQGASTCQQHTTLRPNELHILTTHTEITNSSPKPLSFHTRSTFSPCAISNYLGGRILATPSCIWRDLDEWNGAGAAALSKRSLGYGGFEHVVAYH
jgi:hypothetical protein